MREYMITVIGGAVLAALAHTVSPEKWTKYIKIVTGIMIVSIIVSPVSVMIHGDIFSDFEESTYRRKSSRKGCNFANGTKALGRCCIKNQIGAWRRHNCRGGSGSQ